MTVAGHDEVPTRFLLSPQQERFFQTFGFLHLPGLFTPEIATISEGFEEAFAHAEDGYVLDQDNPFHHTDDPTHRRQVRRIVPGFIERSARLRWLRTDQRLVSIASRLLGDDFEYAQSDGNIFNCDVYWHLDSYQSPVSQLHIKVYFYLDRLRGNSGALRVLPGTNHPDSGYTSTLRQRLLQPASVRDTFGVGLDEIPSWTVDVDPGDVVVGNFRTLHGSFNGGAGRRLFTVNFRQPPPSQHP